MNRRYTLRTNLFVAIVLVVVLSIGLMLAVGSVLTRRAVERATLKDVAHQADLLAARESVSIFPCIRLKDIRPYFSRQNEIAACVSLARPSKYLPPKLQAVLQKKKRHNGTIRIGGTTYFYAARPASSQKNTRELVLLRPKSLGNTAFYPFLVGLLIAAGAGIALAALAAFLLARRIARPVRRVVDATRHLAEERDPEPVPIEGAYEIASLARAFNEMAEQLARARAAEKQFLLSVSHELKTPLTAIRGYAEGVADGAFDMNEAVETISVEAARLERLVRDLLDLARMNRTDFSIHREQLDLATIAREAVRRYEGQAREFGVTLEAVSPAPAPAIGDPDRMLQVTSNLVENALRLTPRGGVVRASAASATLSVEDTGPGLRREDLPRAFERFYLHSRYSSDRPVGTGLGLSIVKELTQGMGGSVDVESTPGQGTRFTVRLPDAPGDDFTDGSRPPNRELTQVVDTSTQN
ncbi:MAG TPA: HAMP domain-containing sensor histidine kinase [Gaiellaceae bacterium]|nr:HAMP domain-containing sensor histidine kinase [Gaiellaceae bacterium]